MARYTTIIRDATSPACVHDADQSEKSDVVKKRKKEKKKKKKITKFLISLFLSSSSSSLFSICWLVELFSSSSSSFLLLLFFNDIHPPIACRHRAKAPPPCAPHGSLWVYKFPFQMAPTGRTHMEPPSTIFQTTKSSRQ